MVSNKCIVTKLKSSVNDINLLKIGELRCEFSKTVKMRDTTPNTFILINSGTILDNTTEYDNNTVNFTNIQNKNDFYCSVIDDTYALTFLRAVGIEFINLEDFVKYRNIQEIDLKYYPVKDLDLNADNVIGVIDFNVIKDIPIVKLSNYIVENCSNIIMKDELRVDQSILNNCNITIGGKNKTLMISGDYSRFIERLYSNKTSFINITDKENLYYIKPYDFGLNNVVFSANSINTVNIEDISLFKNDCQYFSFKNSTIHGDLSNMQINNVFFITNAYVTTQSYAFWLINYQKGGLTYSKSSTSYNYIIALEQMPFASGEDVDRFLIDMSTKSLHPAQIKSLELNANGYIRRFTINSPTPRTTASDDAVEILRNKGFTISVSMWSELNQPSAQTYGASSDYVQFSEKYKVAYKDNLMVNDVDISNMSEVVVPDDYILVEFDTLEEAHKFIEDNGLYKEESSSYSKD